MRHRNWHCGTCLETCQRHRYAFAMTKMIDPVALTQALIKCPSVTPKEAGAIELLADMLSQAGFDCTRVDRGGIANLVARWGTKSPVFGFNGHTDVVPTGEYADWTHPPFAAHIEDGVLFGRGAVDMKSGVAAFVAAAIEAAQSGANGTIVITITGDEEGDALDGTTAIVDWMRTNAVSMDACLVGEPTSPKVLGEMIKIGRRGSMTAYFTARGQQGHSAYPHRAANPIHPLVKLLDRLASQKLDEGTEFFDPSTLAITSIDVGNAANNVIPAKATAMANIRFNDAHKSDDLKTRIEAEIAECVAQTGVEIDVTYKVSGESFITPAGAFSNLVAKAVKDVTGIDPELSTTGGTSDARFIQAVCPVVEFGLVGSTMHQIDERVPISEITQLKTVYAKILEQFFANGGIANA